MLDLGLSFLGSVARDPDALAIVDRDLRLSYAQWYRRISALVAGLDALGLKRGDHIVTLLQNRWEIIITPVNWRSTPSSISLWRMRKPRRWSMRTCRPQPSRARTWRASCRALRSIASRRARFPLRNWQARRPTARLTRSRGPARMIGR